jgi:hypothetical protein
MASWARTLPICLLRRGGKCIIGSGFWIVLTFRPDFFGESKGGPSQVATSARTRSASAAGFHRPDGFVTVPLGLGTSRSDRRGSAICTLAEIRETGHRISPSPVGIERVPERAGAPERHGPGESHPSRGEAPRQRDDSAPMRPCTLLDRHAQWEQIDPSRQDPTKPNQIHPDET